jgi:hypothetical protein
MLRLSVTAALLFALASCTLHDADSAISPAGRPTGLAVVSLTRVGSVEFSLVLKLRGVGHDFSREVILDDGLVARDWSRLVFYTPPRMNDFGRAGPEEPIGRLAVLELPPGDYEFHGWRGTSPIWGKPGDDYALTTGDFSVRFSVQPGRATYLGNLTVVAPNWVNADHYKGEYRLEIGAPKERDLALLAKKYPRIPAETLDTAPMTSTDTGKPLTFYAHPTSGPTRNGGDRSS